MSQVISSIFPSENFMDLNLYQFGWEHCDPSHSFGPAVRNHYLFHYVISGSGILHADNKHGEPVSYHIKGGQGFMIFPDQVCTYIADADEPWEYVWLEFDGLRTKETIEQAGLTPNSPIYFSKDKSLQDTLKNEMLYIVNNKEASSFHLIGHLYLFIDSLIRSSSAEQKTKELHMHDFYVQQALYFIEKNYQLDISVEDIASYCRLNRSYFGKIFHEKIGQSPQEFLINYRMSKACELLKLTDLAIKDISLAVGYVNQLHFSRAFKNTYGISPRQWRYEHIKTFGTSR